MGIRQIASWAIGAPVAILLVCFAVANRQWIDVSLDPINRVDPWASLSMPAFLLFFLGIFIGMIVGGCVVWFKQGKWRKAARKHHEVVQASSPGAAPANATGDALVPALRQPN